MDIKTGMFAVADDRSVVGELRIAGPKSQLVLRDTEFVQIGHDPRRWIVGTLYDLRKVTLVDCVPQTGTVNVLQGAVRAYSVEVFPHFILLGKRHLGADEHVISSIEFTFEDAAAVFHDSDAFGSVIHPEPYIRDIAAANNDERPPRVGPSPLIAYFTGEPLIADVTTALGRISMEHRPQWTPRGPKGVRIDNEIWVRILPEQPIVFDDAIERVGRVLRFLELLAGRLQNLPFLRITVGELSQPDIVGVHWSHHPRRSDHHGRASGGPHPADLPLDPIRRSDEFARVLSGWLATDRERTAARGRFHDSFGLQTYYTVDRLIGAANAFDLLPESVVPKTTSLSNELEDAKRQARALFRSLPASHERSSMLGAIGRIGTASLRQKVRHRASILESSVREKLPDIEWVCDHAVDCRNHFVHGSPVKFKNGSPTDNLAFLTDTLEFVFAAAELVEAGWDLNRYVETPTAMTHPLGAYRVSYMEEVRTLRDHCADSMADE